MRSLRLEIPPEDRYVSLVRHVAAQSARRAGLAEDRIDDVRVAVTEVVSMAMTSIHRLGRTDPVEVEIDIDLGGAVTVRVLDAGGAAEPEPELAMAALENDHDGRFGMVIARALVDRFEVEPRPGGAAVVRLSLSDDGFGNGSSA